MRKICIITGTRAEYGLLCPLMKLLKADKGIELQIIATGMHLSPEFGYTYKQIEEDGFKINKKIEILLSSDSAIGISKSMGLAQISFSEAFDCLNPDLIIVLGDRSEIFSAASAALIMGIPISHIHGGELTEGAYDDAIRHCITKMSHLHFVSTPEYRNRVIQLGEQPENVFYVGAPGLDNILDLNLYSKVEFEESILCKLKPKTILITFHPVTLENDSAQSQFQNLINALDIQKDTLLIFTKPNSDKDGRVIIKMIDEYVLAHSDKAIAFTSLGQVRYLSALKYVDMVVGNSSSGIIEVPSFGIPTINIGDRQKGRVAADSVIHCSSEKIDIINAIYNAYDKDFSQVINPYKHGHASEMIYKKIKERNVISLKKEFYNF